MTTIKVHFEDKQGNTNEVITSINGTPEEISRYYLDKWFNFPDYEDKNGFHVGEIVTDREGQTSCILMIFKNGEVRTDNNGIGNISKLKKLKSKTKIIRYLQELHKIDMELIKINHEKELKEVQK